MEDMNGKLVVITGGSRGLGRACAEAFAARGAELALLASNDARVGKNAREGLCVCVCARSHACVCAACMCVWICVLAVWCAEC